MVTIKPAYHDYTKWMWQFYITRSRPRLDRMLEFSRINWNACNDVYKSLADNDRKLISEYAVQVTNDFAFAGAYAEKNGMTSYNVLNRIKYILRQTAIKRGLWEYQTADRMETERDVYGKAEQTERDGADAVGKAEEDNARTGIDLTGKAEDNRDDRTSAVGKAEGPDRNGADAYRPEVVVDDDVYTVSNDARPYIMTDTDGKTEDRTVIL